MALLRTQYISFRVYFVRHLFLLILRKKLIIAKFEIILQKIIVSSDSETLSSCIYLKYFVFICFQNFKI